MQEAQSRSRTGPQLAAQLRQWSLEAAAAGSPLYARLSLVAAEDEHLLRLLAESLRPGQPAGNMLLGAVHLLLEQQPGEPLRAFYASLCPAPRADEELVPLFLDFTRRQQAALRAIVAQRRVQTNEVGRCSAVAQACAYASRQAGDVPLALIEVGTSAGLNLLFEQYRYRYSSPQGGEQCLGPQQAAVEIEAQWRGPHALVPLPQVCTRIGIDLDPLRVEREADRRWLRALVWPEHRDRRPRLESAMAAVARARPLLLEGSAAEQLPQALALVPEQALPLVLHTHVMHQVAEQERAAIHAQLQLYARHRPLLRLSNDLLPNDGHVYPFLLQHYHGHSLSTQHLANAHGHGRWVEWLAADPAPR